MELFILLILILLNGVFSMTEMAVVSVRKSKLRNEAEQGNKQALRVLYIADQPAYLFSAIQVGVTLIGIFTGLYGGQSFVPFFNNLYANTAILNAYSYQLASITVILITTILTVVFGELVPKQIGITFPERVAKMFAFPVSLFAKLLSPIVYFLTFTTKLITSMLRIKSPDERVTEEEIKVILKESLEDGEIEKKEHDLIERVFSLDDIRVETIMTPMNQVVALYVDDTFEDLKRKISNDAHRFYPIYNVEGNEILGVVKIELLIEKLFQGSVNVEALIENGFYIPESTSVHNALDQMRRNRCSYALVVSEFGMTQGILTQSDIFDALTENAIEESTVADGIIMREDGSLLVDGQYPFFELLHSIEREDLQKDTYDINTVAGFLLEEFDRIPINGEIVEWNGYSFEIVNVDKQRIDKVVVKMIV